MNEYYVSKSGVPCRLIREDFNPYGVLVACKEGETLTVMGLGASQGKKRALRAIHRTLKVAKKWQDSVLSAWEKVKPLIAPGSFNIEKRKI